MKKPYFNNIPESRTTTEVFSGYDHRQRGAEGTFYEMENMSSSHYPLLSPRAPRGLYAKPDSCTGIISKNVLCYTDGKYFVLGGVHIDMGLSDEPKDLISMGAYVIILPDKKYINTVKPEDRGDIEVAFEASNGATFSICDISGEQPCYFLAQDGAPDAVSDGDFWIDTSKEIYTLNVYTRSSGSWGEYETAAVRIEAEGIGEAFEVGDSIIIGGFASSFTCTDKVTVSGDALSSLSEKERYATVMSAGEGFIVVTAPIAAVVKLLGDANKWFWENIDELAGGDGAVPPTSLTQTSALTLSRKMPVMDHVIECGNRLWGCRYGKAENGETVNEIYASKLGDFKNWHDFRGIDSDSWVALCGSDGPFTGAVAYNGHPIFFKENIMYRLYGDVTSAFGYTDVACRGVAPGSGGSLAVVNEVLYYHSRHGICAYDGSLPVSVSDEFGEVRYRDAVSGSLGDRYYVSMSDMSGLRYLFVYDTARRLWHREDAAHAVSFAAFDGDLYYIDGLDGSVRAVGAQLGEVKLAVVPRNAVTVLDTSKEDNWEFWKMVEIYPAHEFTSYLGRGCICLTHSGKINPSNMFRWLSSKGETVQYCLPMKGGDEDIPTSHKYMVVTYASDSPNPSTLYLHDFGASIGTEVVHDMTVSRGRWTASEPVELMQSFFNRFNASNYVVLWSNETALDAKLYISDIRFFEKLADAEAYSRAAADAMRFRPAEIRVPWYCETGIMGTDSPDTKYISRLNVRMSASIGTAVRFFIEYDSSGAWVPVGAIMGRSLGSFTLPICLRRCDHMRLRIEGEGECKVFSITKAVSGGGEAK